MLSERPWKIELIPYLLVGVFLSVCVGSMLMTIPEWQGAKGEPAASQGVLSTNRQKTVLMPAPQPATTNVDKSVAANKGPSDQAPGKTGQGLPPMQRQFALMVANAFFLHGAIFGMLCYCLRRYSWNWDQAFGFARGRASRMLAWGVGGAAVILPVAWGVNKLCAALIAWFHGSPQVQLSVQFLQSDPYLPATVFMGFSTVLLAPVVEEMLFRGVLYPAIKQAGYPRAALLGTSFLFAAYHSNLAIFPPLFLLAVVLTLAYEATDNLFTPILLHALFNAANYWVLVMGWDLDKLFRKLPFCGSGGWL